MSNEQTYRDFYLRSKITVDELKLFPAFENRNEEELKKICDDLFDLAVLFQQINIEHNAQTDPLF
jgi:hypothetical protein